jgi:hypothetical protein
MCVCSKSSDSSYSSLYVVTHLVAIVRELVVFELWIGFIDNIHRRSAERFELSFEAQVVEDGGICAKVLRYVQRQRRNVLKLCNPASKVLDQSIANVTYFVGCSASPVKFSCKPHSCTGGTSSAFEKSISSRLIQLAEN